MTDDTPTMMRCQARPRAARPEYREDMLCASTGFHSVRFCGVSVAVCGIHQSMYARWGDAAESLAMARWGWLPAISSVFPA